MGWEYKVVGLNSRKEDHLNELGAQGWELMLIDQGLAYFKRQESVALDSVRRSVREIPNHHPTRERLKKVDGATPRI